LLSPEQDNSYDIRGMMQKSKNYLLAAETSPLNSQTNNSVLNNSAFNRNVHVNVDSIQVQTQATDAQGVSKAIGKSIESELWKVVNYFSDGRHN